jgi:hypothetical protein
VLHGRASLWFERAGLVHDAMQHALAAGDFERAANLVEHAADRLRMRSEVTTLQAWLDQFPRFLRGAAITVAGAAGLAVIAIAGAFSAATSVAATPSGTPGTNTSFGQLKQIDAGQLNVGYADLGPVNGPAVILLHG